MLLAFILFILGIALFYAAVKRFLFFIASLETRQSPDLVFARWKHDNFDRLYSIYSNLNPKPEFDFNYFAKGLYKGNIVIEADLKSEL